MALPEYPYIDVKDYLALDEKTSSVKYEYFDGHLRMLAGGSPDHSIIATNIASIFHSTFRKTPCRELLQFLKLGKTKISALINQEGLPVYKFGNTYRFDRN